MEYFSVNVIKYIPNKTFCVVRPASLNKPKSNSVMFITDKNIKQSVVFESVKECLIFWPTGFVIPPYINRNHAVVVTDNPHTEYCRFFKDNNIVNLPQNEEVGLLNGAFVSKKASIGKKTIIMPGCYVGSEVKIGDNCYVGAGTKIVGQVSIGNNVIIRENSVIGADGLSTDRDVDGSAITMPQFGSVLIEDNVQIGANTVVARGAIDETVIQSGAKIDNSCFISHNVNVGKNTFIVGETIMFGSSSIGMNSMISGNSTIRNGVNIGESSLVGMGSVVTKNVPDGSIVKGNPAK